MDDNAVLCWAENFANAYALDASLWIRSCCVNRHHNQIVALLELAPGKPGFERLEVRQEDGLQRAGLLLEETFEAGVQPDIRKFRLQPFFREGPGEPVELIIACYPSGFYTASGLTGHPDAVIIHTSPNLHFQAPLDVNPMAMDLTADEIAFAVAEWGALIDSAPEGDHARACILAHAVGAVLAPCNGVPSREMMQASPFEQYRMMKSGIGKGYCENWAVVTVAACKAMGIPARTVWLSQPLQRSDSLLIQYGSSHLTTEIFDKDLNQWIWIDNRFYAMGAWLGEEGPLNLAEFCLFLNQPHRRKRLRLAIRTPDMDSASLMLLDQCPKKSFECFEEWGLIINYRKNSHLHR